MLGVAPAVMLLLSLARPQHASAQNPPAMLFSFNHTVATLDAFWVEPAQPPGSVTVLTPSPFICENITNYSDTEWQVGLGETGESPEIKFDCASYDREVFLSVKGVGSYGSDGFVEMWYEFKGAFAPDASTIWSNCVDFTQEGNVMGLPNSLRDVFHTTFAGNCGDWRIAAVITMNEGFTPSF